MSGFLALEPVWSISSAGIDCRCKAEHLEYAEARVTGRTSSRSVQLARKSSDC